MIEEKKEKLNTGKEKVKTDDQQDEKSKLKSKKRFLKKKLPVFLLGFIHFIISVPNYFTKAKIYAR